MGLVILIDQNVSGSTNSFYIAKNFLEMNMFEPHAMSLTDLDSRGHDTDNPYND